MSDVSDPAILSDTASIDRRGLDLLHALLRGQDPFALAAPIAGAVAGAAFLDFLTRHGLAGYLMAEIRTSEVASRLPDGMLAALRSAYLEQWSRSESLLPPMQEIHSRFIEAGIRHVFLKGPLFAARCYPDLDRRSTSDIDLLVRTAEVERAEALLLGLGFAQISPPIPGRRITMRFTHHFELGRDAAMVELHWTLSRQCGLRLDEDSLWEGSEQYSHEGALYPVPSLETTLLSLILGLATDLALGAARLRSLFDLLQTLKALPQGFPWRAFFSRRRADGSLGLATGLLDLTLELLEARSEMEELDAAIREQGSGVAALGGAERGLDLFCASPPAWSNKQKVFELLAPPSPICWAWWLGSLPWRVAAHRPLRG